jgi:tetratricopeptide (TPR) repeat protein
LEYFERSLVIAEEYSERNYIPLTLNNISTLYFDKGNYVKAIEYSKRAVLIQEEVGNFTILYCLYIVAFIKI